MTTTHGVPHSWRDELVLELRDREVSGADIGDALAHVESFCLDSGQSAPEAFGPAREYAASLHLPSGEQEPTPWPVPTGWALAGHAVQAVALFALASAPAAALRGEPVEIGAPHVTGLVLVLVALTLAVRHLETFIRWCVTSFWKAMAAMQVPFWLTVGAALLAHRALPDAALAVPAQPVVLVAAAVVLAPAVVAQVRHGRAGTGDADVLVHPLEDPARVLRRTRRANLLLRWTGPLLAVLAVATNLVLDLALHA